MLKILKSENSRHNRVLIAICVQKFVAPYWLDLDASGDISDGNAIYFRETQDADSLKRASKIIREAFSSESGKFSWHSQKTDKFPEQDFYSQICKTGRLPPWPLLLGIASAPSPLVLTSWTPSKPSSPQMAPSPSLNSSTDVSSAQNTN